MSVVKKDGTGSRNITLKYVTGAYINIDESDTTNIGIRFMAYEHGATTWIVTGQSDYISATSGGARTITLCSPMVLECEAAQTNPVISVTYTATNYPTCRLTWSGDSTTITSSGTYGFSGSSATLSVSLSGSASLSCEVGPGYSAEISGSGGSSPDGHWGSGITLVVRNTQGNVVFNDSKMISG